MNPEEIYLSTEEVEEEQENLESEDVYDSEPPTLRNPPPEFIKSR